MLAQENQEQRKQLDKSIRHIANLRQQKLECTQFTIVLETVQQKCLSQNGLLYQMQQMCMKEKEAMKQKSVKEYKMWEQKKGARYTKQLETFEQNYIKQREILNSTKQHNTQLTQENAVLKQQLAKERQKNKYFAQQLDSSRHHYKEQHEMLNKTRDRIKELNLIVALLKKGLTSDFTRNEDLVQKLENYQDICRLSANLKKSLSGLDIKSLHCEQLSSILTLFRSSQRISASFFELFPWT